MPEVKIRYTVFEPKKRSVRMKTEERLGGEFPLADVYVPRLVLDELGLSERDQNSAQLVVTVSYSIEKAA